MALALVAVLAAAAPAPGLVVEWQAPLDCPQADELRARVSSLVGEAADRTQLTARGLVAQAGGRWTLTLELGLAASRETRTLVDESCRGLTEAAAVVLAVAIDPLAPGIAGPVPVEQVDAVVPIPPVPVVVEATGPSGHVVEDRVQAPGPVAAPVEREKRRRVVVSVKLGGGLGFLRLLPGVHGVVDVGLALAGRGWRVEASGLFVPPVHAVAVAGIGGVFRVGAGELRGCGVPAVRRAPVAFPLCVGLQLGAMHGSGEGSGLMQQTQARSLWAATRVGAAVRWTPRAGRVSLWLGLDAIVMLTRPVFVTAGGVRVHEAARVGGQVGLGVEVRLR